MSVYSLWDPALFSLVLTQWAALIFFEFAVCWTETCLPLTCREADRLDKADRRCPAQRYPTQTPRRNTLSSPPAPACGFLWSVMKLFLQAARWVTGFLTPSSLPHQEISPSPKRCSSKWSTTQTSRRKWRRNFPSSCELLVTCPTTYRFF